MCERHSFCLTRNARVIDGLGLTDSHTEIMSMHGLTVDQQDRCNLYEWYPTVGWPDASYAYGLTVDRSVFETKTSHELAIERHLRRVYPTAQTWLEPDVIRWSELPLPNVNRVQRAFQLATSAQPLSVVGDDVVIGHVDRHLELIGCDVRLLKVVNASSVPSVVRCKVWRSAWSNSRNAFRKAYCADIRDSSAWWPEEMATMHAAHSRIPGSILDDRLISDSLRANACYSVDCAMVREDSENPFLPLAELAVMGAHLYGVTDDGTVYVWRKETDE